jgi:hypothetical protein
MAEVCQSSASSTSYGRRRKLSVGSQQVSNSRLSYVCLQRCLFLGSGHGGKAADDLDLDLGSFLKLKRFEKV